MVLISWRVLPQHTFYVGPRLTAGMWRYPTTRGHALTVLEDAEISLFALGEDNFVKALLDMRQIANKLKHFYSVRRCALISEGEDCLAILPLHGLDANWKLMSSADKEFNEIYPGYVSSKDAPPMSSERLDALAHNVRVSSGLLQPFNNTFHGDPNDDNLFVKIIRGEIEQWRVWEDAKHVAFLTPFANTTGFTVVVPRKHLSSDIFSLDRQSYIELMRAAYAVGQHLKVALDTDICGMIFEGFEIDYAHVKLIPVLDGKTGLVPDTCEAPFQQTYQGYVTSLPGPEAADIEMLSSDAAALRLLFEKEPPIAPRIEP